MKKICLSDSWPDSWKLSFHYDQQEVYGNCFCLGYAYAYKNRQRYVIEAIETLAPKGSRVLDIAAGQGNYTLLLAEAGFEVTWNDLRNDLAEYVKLKYEKGHVHFAPGNAFELNFKELFDVVLISEIIEHVAHPDDFLEKVSGLVRKGGFIVMTTPNGEYCRNSLPKFSDCSDPSKFEKMQFKPNSDGHIFALHTDEVLEIAKKANLTTKEIRLLNNPLTSGHIKMESILKILPQKTVDRIERITSKPSFWFYQKINSHLFGVFQK